MIAEWIWYPGEFETRTVNLVNSRRYFRDIPQPPVWKSFGVWPSVKFVKRFTLGSTERIEIRASGEFNAEVDFPGNFVRLTGDCLELCAGEHSLCIHVFCKDGKLPAVWVRGDTLVSNADWQCTLLDDVYVSADCGGFTDKYADPNYFSLPVQKKYPVRTEQKDGYILCDFGEEYFGFCRFSKTNLRGGVKLYYGESCEEAEDFDFSEQCDYLPFTQSTERTQIAKAFRYISVVCENGAKFGDFCAESEFNPQKFTAEFISDNRTDNDIWKTAQRTFALNTREFFLDGIKRDRWVWSGDASQSYLINKYCFFDTVTERRTIVALCGKGEIHRHFNTITDYTLYWLISFYDYYRYTGDIAFIRRWAPRFREVLSFCLGRTDDNGLLLAPRGEWVFIDWSEAVTKNSDCYAFIQILLYGALCSAAKVSKLLDDFEGEKTYSERAEKLKKLIHDLFWCKEKGGFTHSLVGGKSDGLILKQTNIMAVLMRVADSSERQSILHQVLLNDKISAITTPYMRFYEFSALCELGETERVAEEMRSYFKGMIDLGATTFWEQYDPKDSGIQHYAMYGRKYGKSLCHAWGATAIYIIGRYFIGLSPENDGYDRFVLRPSPNILNEYFCRLPLKDGGEICIEKKNGEYRVTATRDGCAVVAGKTTEITANREVRFAAEK